MSPYDIDPKEGTRLPVLYGLCDGHLGTNAARYLANEIEEVREGKRISRSFSLCADTIGSRLRAMCATRSSEPVIRICANTATRGTSAAVRVQL